MKESKTTRVGYSGMLPRRAALVQHPTRGSSLLLFVSDLLIVGLTSIAFSWEPAWSATFVPLVLAIIMARGHYRTRMAQDIGEDASMIAGGIAAAGLTTAIAVTVIDVTEPTINLVVVSGATLFAVLLASRTLAFILLRRLRRRGYLRSRALVVGTGSIAREIGVEFAQQQCYGVDIAGYVSESGLKAQVRLPGPIVGNLADLSELARLTASDRVIVTLGMGSEGEVVNALRTLSMLETSIFVMPQLFELGMGADTMTPDHARGFALVRLGRSAHPVIGVRLKRLFDIAASALALLILLPVLLLAALAVRLSGEGPILFRQQRVGQSGSAFELFKFRSMKPNSDSETAWTPQSSEATITRAGKFLRWSSIDELPQLVNIIRGDMSIVGPRPERPTFVEHFTKTIPGYIHRHRMPVGLTGLAQVKGLRGDTPMEERTKFDNLYIDQWSFFGDLRLIVRTLWSIPRQHAYAEAEIVMSRDLALVDRQEQVVLDLVADARIGDAGATPSPPT